MAAAATHSFALLQEKLGLEVRMVASGLDAAATLRLTTTTSSHASAHLMLALQPLDLQVQHACVCRVGGVTVQDAVVDVPAGLRDERCLCSYMGKYKDADDEFLQHVTENMWRYIDIFTEAMNGIMSEPKEAYTVDEDRDIMMIQGVNERQLSARMAQRSNGS